MICNIRIEFRNSFCVNLFKTWNNFCNCCCQKFMLVCLKIIKIVAFF